MSHVEIAVQTFFSLIIIPFFRNCQQVASLARPEAIKMLSEVRRRADGQAKSGTSQLDAQLVTQVVFA